MMLTLLPYTTLFRFSLPGVAQVAIQGGEFVADRIRAAVKGAETPDRFRYRDKGTLAVIGRNAAVAAISRDRKSTRLNSSHRGSSYAAFCLKTKRSHSS